MCAARIVYAKRCHEKSTLSIMLHAICAREKTATVSSEQQREKKKKNNNDAPHKDNGIKKKSRFLLSIKQLMSRAYTLLQSFFFLHLVFILFGVTFSLHQRVHCMLQFGGLPFENGGSQGAELIWLNAFIGTFFLNFVVYGCSFFSQPNARARAVSRDSFVLPFSVVGKCRKQNQFRLSN